ncbi:MAG: hypothetical protein V4735_02800 [Pseudomonadota bacterium]
MGIAREGQQIIGAAQRVGNAFFDSFTNFAKNWKNGSAVAPIVAEAPSVWTAPFRASARAGAWVVEQPIALAMKPVKWALNGTAGFYTKFPRLAPIATVGAAAVAAGSWLSNRKGVALQQQFEGQAMAAQAAGFAPQQSYMNSASQVDVDARIAADKANGVAGSHAERAAAPAATMETAAGL